MLPLCGRKNLWGGILHKAATNPFSTFAFTASSILSRRRRRLKPSPGHLFVASLPGSLPVEISRWRGRAHRPASLFHQRVARFELGKRGEIPVRGPSSAHREQWTPHLAVRAQPADLGGGWGRLFWRDKRQGAKYRRVMHWKSPARGSQLKAVASLLLVAALPSTAPAAGEVMTNLHRLAPSVVHDAETCIVRAAVGACPIRPHGLAPGQECATLKAFVRT